MLPSHLAVASALAAGALAGCEPTAPANPSWQVDVMPIIAANCIRCHGAPPIFGAPSGLRFDSFDSLVDDRGSPGPLDDVLVYYGAADYAATIECVTTAACAMEMEINQMPPRFPLEPYQIETLKNWVPDREFPQRGEPRPGNQPPVLTLREVGRDPTGVTLAYELRDPDGDLVSGYLCDDYGASCRFAAVLRSGTGEVRIDTTTRFPGPLALRARLDDGAGVIDQAALTIGVP